MAAPAGSPRAAPATPRPRGSSVAGKAYWAMVRRVTLIAAAIDVGYLLLFAWLGSAPLAMINVVSIAMYATAYWLIGRKRNTPALWLIWIEVMGHAAVGSLLIGWDSGFHYFLLLFIPAIVIANSRGFAVPMVGALLAYYLGLKSLCDHYGALMPLAGHGQKIVFWVHVCLVFGMSSSIAAYYRHAILVAERRLFKQATSDPLTGLHNRGHFQALANVELARSQRTQAPLALLLCDIDHFKQVNDRHGHDVGDKVLIHVAGLLKGNLRECDALARWGGEEFIVLMPECPPAEAEAVAERIRLAVAATPLTLPAQAVPATLSLGVATVTHAADLDAATVRADRALYESKRAGRNRVTVG